LLEWPDIDVSKCIGCGVCVTVCCNHSLILVDGRVQLIKIGECDWCGQCEAVCPTGAIGCPYEIVLED